MKCLNYLYLSSRQMFIIYLYPYLAWYVFQPDMCKWVQEPCGTICPFKYCHLSHNDFGNALNFNFAAFCNFMPFNHMECIANYANAHGLPPNAIWANLIS